jgi:hypothetical protein
MQHFLTKKEKSKGGKNLQKLLKNKIINKKRIQGIIQAYKNPEYKKKLSKSQKLRFKKQEEKDKISLGLKLYHEKNPDAAREVYREHPNLKEESRKRFIAWIIKNKDALKYIKRGEGNKLKLSTTTNNNEKVRSLYETMVANYLKKKKIKYEYEAKMLIFQDYKKLKITFAIPDFFLPEYNSIIEIYGQYPEARKTTIKKNRAYRYYNIPFLGITPSTISEIDNIIPKFIKETGRNHKLTKQARKLMWGTLS